MKKLFFFFFPEGVNVKAQSDRFSNQCFPFDNHIEYVLDFFFAQQILSIFNVFGTVLGDCGTKT